jgi:hypothetical protein
MLGSSSQLHDLRETQMMPGSKCFRVLQPHWLIAVIATTALGVEGSGSGFGRSRHG